MSLYERSIYPYLLGSLASAGIGGMSSAIYLPHFNAYGQNCVFKQGTDDEIHAKCYKLLRHMKLLFIEVQYFCMFLLSSRRRRFAK